MYIYVYTLSPNIHCERLNAQTNDCSGEGAGEQKATNLICMCLGYGTTPARCLCELHVYMCVRVYECEYGRWLK